MNYAELKATLADWLHTTAASAQLDLVIDMAEAEINRRLRHRAMVTRATSTIPANDEFLSLPADFLEMKQASIAGQMLAPAPLGALTQEAVVMQGVGTPQWFSVSGTSLRLYPRPGADTVVTMAYYAAVPALSVTITSNWLSTAAPDVYSYGCLVQACRFVHEDERLPMWQEAYESALQNLIRSDRRGERGENAPRLRVDAGLTSGAYSSTAMRG